MAFGGGNRFQHKAPLYIFYDCETTGMDVQADKIIEVAAVIHLATLKPETRIELRRNDHHEFSSLCFCDRELGEIPQKMTGLTKEDLKDEPPLQDVLKRFFEWIQTSIATASKLDGKGYTPVLVAHSGNILDYPLLLKEADVSPFAQQLKDLNLHFVDTFHVFRDLERTTPDYRIKLKSLSLTNIYKAYFRIPHEGHRALADARALCKIFSEASPAEDIKTFEKHMQDLEETKVIVEQLQKFKNASISTAKAIDILAKGIKFERLVKEFQTSPGAFHSFLKMKCGIANPKPELIRYISSQAGR